MIWQPDTKQQAYSENLYSSYEVFEQIFQGKGQFLIFQYTDITHIRYITQPKSEKCTAITIKPFLMPPPPTQQTNGPDENKTQWLVMFYTLLINFYILF